MKGEAFLRHAIGDQGYEALSAAVAHVPELEAVILPRVAIAYLHVADEICFQGQIEGTDALLKAGEIWHDGFAAVIGAELPAAAALLCHAAGCDDLQLPQTLEPRRVARLAKSVELMTKAHFLKRIQELQNQARAGEGSETSTPSESASEESTLEKGTELPGKAAEPRGPQAPTAPAPQSKQPGQTQQQPNPVVSTQGTKKPTT